MYKRYLSKIGGVLRIGWDGVTILKDQKEEEDECVGLKIDLLRNGNILKVDDNARGSVALLIQENGGRCLVAVLQLLQSKLKMVSRNMFVEDIYDMLIYQRNEVLLIERDKVVEFDFKRKTTIRKVSLLQAYLPRSIFQGQVVKSVTQRNSADTFVNFFQTSEKVYLRLFDLNSPSSSSQFFIAQLHSKVSQFVVLKTNIFVVSIEAKNQIAVLQYKHTERQLETLKVFKLRSVGVLQNIQNNSLANKNRPAKQKQQQLKVAINYQQQETDEEQEEERRLEDRENNRLCKQQEQLKQCQQQQQHRIHKSSYLQHPSQQKSHHGSSGKEVLLLANFNESNKQVDLLEVTFSAGCGGGSKQQRQQIPGETAAASAGAVDIKVQRVVDLTTSSLGSSSSSSSSSGSSSGQAQNVLMCDENQSVFDCVHSRGNSNQFVKVYVPARLRPKPISSSWNGMFLPLKEITNNNNNNNNNNR